MHSSFNQRLANKDQSQGHVASYFENLHTLLQLNDGTRSFILRTVDCHDQSAPFSESQETRIQITHDDHMISQISDGFLTFKVNLSLQLTGIDSGFSDSNNLCKLFVGINKTNAAVKVSHTLPLNHLQRRRQENIHIAFTKTLIVIALQFVAHILISKTLKTVCPIMWNLKLIYHLTIF